jgi:hypothetical protein
MARTVKNTKIDSRSARSKLPKRGEPYWTVISAGCAVAYRKGAKGGTWIARLRGDDGRQHYEALGAADDARDSDGLTVFSFMEAQEGARKFFSGKARELAGHVEPHAGTYTIKLVLDDYFAARESRGSKGVRADRYVAGARIVPDLGNLGIDKLTAKRIREWHVQVAAARNCCARERRLTSAPRMPWSRIRMPSGHADRRQTAF